MPLNREQILGADDARIETVAVPEWGGDVCVRVMAGDVRDRWEANLFVEDDGDRELNHERFRARLLAATVCDEKGLLLFSAADLAALGAKSSVAADRVLDVAQRLNMIRQADREAARKNS